METGGVDVGVTDDVSTSLAKLLHTAEAADEELTDPVDGTKLCDIIESQSPSNLSKKSSLDVAFIFLPLLLASWCCPKSLWYLSL